MKDLEKEATSLRRQLDLAAEKVRKQEETSQETQVIGTMKFNQAPWVGWTVMTYFIFILEQTEFNLIRNKDGLRKGSVLRLMDDLPKSFWIWTFVVGVIKFGFKLK